MLLQTLPQSSIDLLKEGSSEGAIKGTKFSLEEESTMKAAAFSRQMIEVRDKSSLKSCWPMLVGVSRLLAVVDQPLTTNPHRPQLRTIAWSSPSNTSKHAPRIVQQES